MSYLICELATDEEHAERHNDTPDELEVLAATLEDPDGGVGTLLEVGIEKQRSDSIISDTSKQASVDITETDEPPLTYDQLSVNTRVKYIGKGGILKMSNGKGPVVGLKGNVMIHFPNNVSGIQKY